MTTKKITELTELTTVADADIIPIVDDVAGTPITKKITFANLILGYLKNLVEDTTPQLGGELDCQNNIISAAKTVGFNSELDGGTETGNFSVDFSLAQKQKTTLTANTITLTLDTTDLKVGNYLLKIVNGGLTTLTWAAESGSIFWPGGSAPTLTSSGTDIGSIYFDGTNFWAQAGLDFN